MRTKTSASFMRIKRTTVATATVTIILSLAFLDNNQVSAARNVKHQFASRKWNLPAKIDNIQKEQSIAAFVSNLPRGGQYGYDDRGGYGNGADGYDRGYYNDNNDYNGDYYKDDSDDDGGYYDDRGRGSEKGRGRPSFDMPNIIKTGNRKIGLPLLGIGIALSLVGASLFFNKTLMRLGNLFFVAGIPMTIGPGRTASYFLQPKKARATGCLFFGIFLVFVGHPVLGILLEIFGLLNLFGNMFPVAMAVLKTMPGIGPLLKGKGSSSSRRGNDRYDDDRYDDGYYDDRYQDDRDSYYDDRNYYGDRGNDDDDDYRGYY